MQKRNFHTFDALRFFAYFKVFIFHLPLLAFPAFTFIKDNGGIGVLFFFVLSGFLITYIILEEKEQTGKLDLKHFFARRILRIWPLYYLMIAFVYLSPFLISALGMEASGAGYEPRPVYSLTFTENYRMIMENDHPDTSPLGVMWSLCIEEHFYIVWGLLLFFINKRYLPHVIILSCITGIISRMYFFHMGWKTIDLFTNIDLFALGAIPAWLLIAYGGRFEEWIRKTGINYKRFYVLLLITAVYVFPLCGVYFREVFMPGLLGAMFSLLIILILPAENKFRIGRKNVLSRWGVWTYGLYLYHTIVINLFLQFFARLEWPLSDPMYAISFAIITFFVTLTISYLSYQLFEKPFLRLKKYFY